MRGTIWQNTRVILFLGFGSLLLLIAVLGLGAYRRSGRIYRDVTYIHNTYWRQAAILNEIQSDIYLSAILIRDYLLDPLPMPGVEHRRQLLQVHQTQEERLIALQKISAADDREPLQRLRNELEAYWRMLDPVFEWTADRKAALSYSFLRKEVLPRRAVLLQLTNGINLLNEGSLVKEQERITSSWSAYRKYLAWMFGYALSLALFTAVVSVQRLFTLEKRAGVHRLRLEDTERRLRLLSRKLVDAQEEERKSLSRELHDEVGQMLTGLRMIFGNLEQLRSAPGEDFHRQLAEGKGVAEQALQMVRNLALGLRPSMLDDLGLEPALEWQSREFSRRSGIPVDFKTDGSLENVPEKIRTCIYRLVQESLTNCARHARAKSVRIDLHGGRTELSLTVRDDGTGFDSESLTGRGLGIIGMEERVRELGGTLNISSQPGKGTLLHALLPLNEMEQLR